MIQTRLPTLITLVLALAASPLALADGDDGLPIEPPRAPPGFSQLMLATQEPDGSMRSVLLDPSGGVMLIDTASDGAGSEPIEGQASPDDLRTLRVRLAKVDLTAAPLQDDLHDHVDLAQPVYTLSVATAEGFAEFAWQDGAAPPCATSNCSTRHTWLSCA